MIDIPGMDQLLDETYMAYYDIVRDQVESLLSSTVRERCLDYQRLQRVVIVVIDKLAADGAKAFSQIHNMERQGDYVVQHSLNVGIMAALMGNWLGWDEELRRELVVAGLLHDIGKLCIDKNLMNKSGRLTPDEFAIIKRHTEYGAKILQEAGETRPEVVGGVSQHHERNDGSGYPLGLRGENISVFGRILSFLDIYDAMASNRAYASKKSPFEAFAVMGDDMKEGRLDPEFAVQFMKNTSRALVGTWVELSDGERGRIVYIPESRIGALPMVQTIYDKFVDLEHRKDITIKAILTARELLTQ